MKFSTLLGRLRTSGQALRSNPGLVMRLPRFVWRCLREGPRVSLYRIRRITDPSRSVVDYEDWRAEFDPTAKEREAMVAWAHALQSPPRIAVLMPVFNPRPEWLQVAIESVRAQLYPYWQLCIADDCSTDPRIRLLLEQVKTSDSRIQVIFRQKNGHICAASNTALELVESPWVSLLDHDDQLLEDALVWVAKAIIEHPDAGMLYSDEDKIAPTGQYQDPYFKPDWDPVLMEGQNMFSHLGTYRTQLVRDLGGFRLGFEGAQDHDLALRCSELLSPKQIVHIPRVLYHWRTHSRSTATSQASKPYSYRAAEKAVFEHLQRRQLPVCNVQRVTYGMRTQWLVPDPSPLVSVIIPTRNGLHVLRPCLISLLEKTLYNPLEVLVVDNGSDDLETLKFLATLRESKKITIIRDDSPFNYSALNKLAAEYSSGELVCLLNNDIEVICGDWLRKMVAQVLREGVGAVGARLLYPDRTIQHGGVFVGIGGVAGHAYVGQHKNTPGYYCRAQLAQQVSAVTAACLLVRKEHFLGVGGLNAEQLKVAFNDVDFCLKLREHGLVNIYEPAAVLIHHESVSRGYEDTPDKQKRFASEVAYMQKNWNDSLHYDPAYNPNLSYDCSPFTALARPPRLARWGE